ncbi:LacI family DNA-binding transcriptional regulator [Bifidobacterium castoris]|uniref:Transcriptional regulator, LacI family n=1 Tax=Bifidobacterium castoris TaxID=2306972 RepID=A0A430F8M9_9BIFI|nr:LacI family DNA-binding transcriptional regulator [Bifidobacterium castoris]RSX49182.1 transcriptional regulator, LacI family [Bifidobacterium castoris]
MKGDTPARKRPTRADVAKLAGVSVATVSFALNHDPRISPPTTQRVVEAASQLGYRPNTLAKSLQSGITHTLGLVMPDISNPYFGALAEQLEQVAIERGCTLLVNLSHGDPGLERTRIDELLNRQVDAIFISSAQSDSELEKLSRTGHHIVLLDRCQPVGGLRSVSSDLHQAAYDATMHLFEHGRRTIALLAGSDNPADMRTVGWRDACRNAGVPAGPLVSSGFTAQDGYLSTLNMLDETQNHIDAIFASSDLVCVGALRAVRERGLRVPDDIAMISLDGTFITEYTDPPMTVIRQDTAAIAHHAVAAALDADAPLTQIIDTTLILRRSCGCPNL